MKLGALGEKKLLKIIRSELPESELNDDCFVARNGLVVTTDAYSWKDLPSNAFKAGRKAIACNASDAYSTGAAPEYYFVNLGLPRSTDSNWVKRFYSGMRAEAKKAGGRIAGGDVDAGDYCSITAIGKTKKPLLRKNCRIGDRLIISNPVGAAAAGYTAQKKGFACPSAFKKALETPEPNYSFCKRAWRRAHAGMDVSDGLSFTLHELARESKKKIILNYLPLHSQLPVFCARHGLNEFDIGLNYGEDYSVVYSGKFGKGFAHVTSGSGVFLPDGVPLLNKGWDSLKV